MKFVVRLKTIGEITELISMGADVFLVDTPLAVKKVGLEMYDLLETVFSYGKEVYLLVNKMIHEEDINTLTKILLTAKYDRITGVVAGDLTVMVKAKELGVAKKVIYQPGTMNTNSFDNEYFFLKEIKGITISKEITMSEITKIFTVKKTELSLVGHGFIDMFYSKRKLLTNYFIFKNIVRENIRENPNFRLNEEMRKDSYYPIFEDNGGTHVFRDLALESFDEVEELAKALDDFFIERIFIGDEEYYDSLKVYNNKMSREIFLEKYQGKYNKGFFYQSTEKTKGELDEN